ncbi:hypothetical protein DAI22_12g092200 [Oryza sativa Japonica Group]|nr:hypothetical protein DAI22_12g092200 [Oryza sativa Japonica Group]
MATLITSRLYPSARAPTPTSTPASARCPHYPATDGPPPPVRSAARHHPHSTPTVACLSAAHPSPSRRRTPPLAVARLWGDGGRRRARRQADVPLSISAPLPLQRSFSRSATPPILPLLRCRR